MLSSTRQFTDAMDNKGIKYEYKGTTDSGKDIVVLGYTCENISTLTLRFFFDEDCEAVAIRMFDLVKFPESKLPTMLAAINQQNARFRFVKFVIDTNDHTVQAEADVAFRSHDVGDICLEYVSRPRRRRDSRSSSDFSLFSPGGGQIPPCKFLPAVV